MSDTSASQSTPPAGGEHDPKGTMLEPEAHVLATLRSDGTRRWIRPRLSQGQLLKARRVVAYGLMVFFVALPHLTIKGKPAVLLDILHREFTLFGTTFVPTDTPLLLLFLLSLFVTVFLATALVGRVWCGWACPQTVYMEFLYRPLDRFFEGTFAQQQKIDREGGSPRRALKNVVFVLISAFLAHTFLAYFVGWKALIGYMTSSPFTHPTAFLVVLGVTAAMSFDFMYFREQTCLIACPYGRFQSVLLDDNSLIVGYDRCRGEPRGKPKKKRKRREPRALPTLEREASQPQAGEPQAASGPAQPVQGDCIDCGACVITCPTGIDIRDGLQLECINCTQCIDACDAIMDKVGQPRGLIRYGSRTNLEEGKPQRVVRPRVLIYSVALVLLLAGLFAGLSGRQSAKVTLLRGLGKPYAVLPSGEISNQMRLKVRNQGEEPRSYTIELLEPAGAQLVAPENPLAVKPGELKISNVFVVLPREAYAGAGQLRVRFKVSDGADFETVSEGLVLGPEE